MIEFNGWVSLGMRTDEKIEEQVNKVLPKLKEMIQPFIAFNQILDFRQLNGVNYLMISGNHNHDNGYCEDLFDIMRMVGELMPGSYGLLFIRNTEDELWWNEFLIYRLARGKVEKLSDQLLSPCNPVIED